MLSLFQGASTLEWVKLLGKISSTTLKIPPSSTYPWALILEHSVMWNGISLWPCLSVPVLGPKILPNCWGRWGQVTPARYERLRGLLRKSQPWAPGTSLGTAWGQAQLEAQRPSRAHGQLGEGCGGWRPALLQLHWARQQQLIPPGAGVGSRVWAMGGGTDQGHCPSTDLQTLTKVVCVGNFTLLLIISITIWRTHIFILLSKCSALCLNYLFFCHEAAIKDFFA